MTHYSIRRSYTLAVTLFAVFSLKATASDAASANCAALTMAGATGVNLNGTTAIVEERSNLGSGVLIETHDGRLFLGKSFYAGRQHKTIVDHFKANFPVSRILWMGELRYRMVGRLIQILEANETSGHYTELLASVAGEGNDIEVLNDVNNIPPAIRSQAFQPVRNTPEHRHLIAELATLPPSINIRHSAGTSLAILASAFRRLNGGNDEMVDFTLEALNGFTRNHVILVKHLLLTMITDNQLEAESVDDLIQAVLACSAPQVSRESFRDVDLNAAISQLQIVGVRLPELATTQGVAVYEISRD